MYQDKIPQSVIDAIEGSKRVSPYPSIFESKKLSPLTFEPTEFLTGICQIAKDILKDRSDEEVIIISKAIKSMSEQGGAFAMALIRSDKSRDQLYISQGRELYFLSHYYDITTIPVKKLTWSEVLAVLVLMQCAEVTVTSNQTYNDDELSQALKVNAENFSISMQSEIADSISRAECLFDKSFDKKKISKAGGKAKADYIKPLKEYVIHLYIESFSSLNPKKAGSDIFKQMTNDNNTLLLRSSAEDKDLLFAGWIRAFLKGEDKIPVK